MVKHRPRALLFNFLVLRRSRNSLRQRVGLLGIIEGMLLPRLVCAMFLDKLCYSATIPGKYVWIGRSIVLRIGSVVDKMPERDHDDFPEESGSKDKDDEGGDKEEKPEPEPDCTLLPDVKVSLLL